MSAPTCPTCMTTCRLTTGAEVYRARPDLAGKQIWLCDGCGARVGCHPGTTTPLGTPADHATRIARMTLHNQRLDPLWQNAWRDPSYAEKAPLDNRRRRSARKDICRCARNRVYAWLAHQLGMSADECHTGLFSVEQCRAAWAVLTGVTYGEIREWAREREAAERRSKVAA